MRKVYAVWRGTYSDPDVIAIFSTEALAEKFREEYNKAHDDYDETRLRVYEVDAQIGYNVTKFWQTSIACASGDIYVDMMVTLMVTLLKRLYSIVGTRITQNILSHHQPNPPTMLTSWQSKHGKNISD
jgi:hypothetical protein